jgi:hypothetical protein
MSRFTLGSLRMAERPDKPKVVDEVWDDDRVKSFLHADADVPCVDFYVLLKAYQGMRAHDFERFTGFFVEAGRDLDARNEQGQTLVTVITQHRHARPFIESLLAAGAAPFTAADGGAPDSPLASPLDEKQPPEADAPEVGAKAES